VIASYNLLINYMIEMLAGMEIRSADRLRLETVISTLMLRDMGLTMEGFWRASHGAVSNEQADVADQLGMVEDLLSGIPHYVWSVDLKSNKVIYANYPLHSLYPEALQAPFPCLADTREDDQQQLTSTWQNAVSGSNSYAEIRMSLAGGGEHWYRVSLFPSLNRLGKPVLMHCVLEDINHMISERKILERLATTDRLTNLPNRALWADHLNLALAASRRVPGSQVVVISVDINQFKMYNDTLGRDVGDILLQDVAARLDSIIRESDSLARLGGDRFGVLLQPVNNARTATDRVITQILDTFDIPFSYQDKQLCISLTMGIALFPEDGTNEESLLTKPVLRPAQRCQPDGSVTLFRADQVGTGQRRIFAALPATDRHPDITGNRCRGLAARAGNGLTMVSPSRYRSTCRHVPFRTPACWKKSSGHWRRPALAASVLKSRSPRQPSCRTSTGQPRCSIASAIRA
jgi:diguanylate cyclase (GGDEF)-like protein